MCLNRDDHVCCQHPVSPNHHLAVAFCSGTCCWLGWALMEPLNVTNLDCSPNYRAQICVREWYAKITYWLTYAGKCFKTWFIRGEPKRDSLFAQSIRETQNCYKIPMRLPNMGHSNPFGGTALPRFVRKTWQIWMHGHFRKRSVLRWDSVAIILHNIRITNMKSVLIHDKSELFCPVCTSKSPI